MRRWGVLVALMVTACGSSPPTMPSPTQSPTDLESGSYRLVVTMATTGDPVCNGPFCSSISLCLGGAGAQPVAVISPTTVTLQRTGNAVVVRDAAADATFTMKLQLGNGTLSGTASGEFRTGGALVQVDGGSPQSDALVTGTIRGDSVTGKLTGSVTVNGGGCSNNGHTWALTPQ